jgi:xanthine dehydrogenase accessory factor
MDLTLLSRLNEARRARRAVIRVTDIATGAERLVFEADVTSSDPLAGELSARFRSGKSGMIDNPDGGKHFLTVHVPPPRIVIIGAAHISQALAPMAGIAGFDIAIVDPRTAFATEERFAGSTLHAEWPKDVIPAKVTLDAYSALVAVTHDPKIDDWPIAEALTTGCFYVGALGSRKTHAKRVERLQALGVSDINIKRIAAPIGLNIGAQSPAEIAVSILAQIIEALRLRPAHLAALAPEPALSTADIAAITVSAISPLASPVAIGTDQ